VGRTESSDIGTIGLLRDRRTMTEPSDTAERPFWLAREWWLRTSKASIGLWTATLLSFASTVLAANSLGPERYGPLVLALSTVLVVVTFLDFPLEEAVVHYGSRALSAGDPGSLHRLLRTALRVDLAVGVPVFVALIVMSGPVASLVSGGRLDPSLVQIAALDSLLRTVDGTTGAALLLSSRPQLRAWSMAWTSLMRLVFVAVGVSVGGVKAVLVAFVASSLGGSCLQALLAWRTGWRDWRRAASSESPSVPIRRLALFGLNSGITTTAIAARLGIVSIILGRAAGPTQVGILHVATFPVTLAGVVSAPIRMTMYPEQARLAAERRPHLLWRSIRDYTLLSLAVGVAGGVVGWFLLPWLLPTLYGEEFVSAIAPGRVMLLAGVATLAVAWSKPLPAAIGRPALRTVVSIGELAATAVLMVVLARYGAIGAATTVSLVTGGIGVLWWWLTRRILSADNGGRN
jgi:O-antigen/teichoic acid export membrane protein